MRCFVLRHVLLRYGMLCFVMRFETLDLVHANTLDACKPLKRETMLCPFMS